VSTTGPATGSTEAIGQFFTGSADSSAARLGLLGTRDPADELVSGQWREGIPPFADLGVVFKVFAKVCR
jgi:hypothetical protein